MLLAKTFGKVNSFFSFLLYNRLKKLSDKHTVERLNRVNSFKASIQESINWEFSFPYFKDIFIASLFFLTSSLILSLLSSSSIPKLFWKTSKILWCENPDLVALISWVNFCENSFIVFLKKGEIAAWIDAYLQHPSSVALENSSTKIFCKLPGRLLIRFLNFSVHTFCLSLSNSIGFAWLDSANEFLTRAFPSNNKPSLISIGPGLDKLSRNWLNFCISVLLSIVVGFTDVWTYFKRSWASGITLSNNIGSSSYWDDCILVELDNSIKILIKTKFLNFNILK